MQQDKLDRLMRRVARIVRETMADVDHHVVLIIAERTSDACDVSLALGSSADTALAAELCALAATQYAGQSTEDTVPQIRKLMVMLERLVEVIGRVGVDVDFDDGDGDGVTKH